MSTLGGRGGPPPTEPVGQERPNQPRYITGQLPTQYLGIHVHWLPESRDPPSPRWAPEATLPHELQPANALRGIQQCRPPLPGARECLAKVSGNPEIGRCWRQPESDIENRSLVPSPLYVANPTCKWGDSTGEMASLCQTHRHASGLGGQGSGQPAAFVGLRTYVIVLHGGPLG
jgi:hypothetical protein